MNSTHVEKATIVALQPSWFETDQADKWATLVNDIQRVYEHVGSLDDMSLLDNEMLLKVLLRRDLSLELSYQVKTERVCSEAERSEQSVVASR